MWRNIFLVILLLLVGCNHSIEGSEESASSPATAIQEEENAEPQEEELERENDIDEVNEADKKQENKTSNDAEQAATEHPKGIVQEEATSKQSEKPKEEAVKKEAVKAEPAASEPAKQKVQATSPPAKEQSTQNTVQDKRETEKPVSKAVSISITGDTAMGQILSSEPVELKEGDTVLEILKKVTKANQLQMEYSGRGMAAYVEGINNLYEFDKGPKSGWMYKINGKFVSKSAGAVNVSAGDKIEWLYTLDLGRDIGKGFE
ncbi:DUF4430 domain-containing protein [Bacillus tianshenii]|nr:DUF4430 domain-containing protein [Bacillus tianshenii]